VHREILRGALRHLNEARDVMSLAIDARMLQHSGIGTYLRNLLPRLIPLHRGGHVHLLGDEEFLRRLPWTQGGALSFVDCRSPIYSIREQIALPRLIPGDCGLFWSPHFNVPMLYRGPLLVTIHDILHVAMPRYMPGLHKRLYARALLTAVRRKASAVICDSRFTADELMRVVGVPASKIEVIHLGVDEAWFAVAERTSPEEKPYFIFVGNVKAHKNVAGLVNAFGRVADKIPHHLVIVGKKEGFITGDRTVEASAAELGERVKFTGHVDDALLRRYVASAQALVLPSFYEGFGFPPLEAMACGCPAIVSDRASLPEVCGDAALYCNPDDVEDIAARMLEVAGNEALRAQLREKGLARAREFTWDRCARETLAVIERLQR
jgi:glycosyltransferase involved in cell wall biosynthesis